MGHATSTPSWTFLHPLPGPRWYASAWGDGARWEVVRPAAEAPKGTARSALKSLATWQPGCFLAGGDDELLRSDDGGRTWRDVTPPRLVRNITEVCTTASGQWFVGALERIVRSDDQGTTWQVEHKLTGTAGSTRCTSSPTAAASPSGRTAPATCAV